MGGQTAAPRRVGQLDHDPESLVWARKQAGFTQKELAASIGIAASTLSLIESGKRNATPKNIAKIAKVLRCPKAVISAKVREETAVA